MTFLHNPWRYSTGYSQAMGSNISFKADGFAAT